METKQQAPERGPQRADRARWGASQEAPRPPMQAKPAAESHRAGVTVRVAVLNDRHDEEENEAGYGHGV